jgi:hypothetical protein
VGERSRAEIEPDDVAAVERHRQAVELVAEIERIDDMKRASRERISSAVEASATTLRAKLHAKQSAR